MAHEITQRESGFWEVAWTGEAPWHQLGQCLSPDASLDTWYQQSGLNWRVRREIPGFASIKGYQLLDGHRVLVRSDNDYPLGLVSERYQPVQPIQILETFRTLIDDCGYRMECAGSLFGGKKIWALARTGLGGDVLPGDRLHTFLLLSTSYDKSESTTARFTCIRTVCNNTLQLASTDSNCEVICRIPHDQAFDHSVVHERLGVGSAQRMTHDFIERMQRAADTTVTVQLAKKMTRELFIRSGVPVDTMENYYGFQSVMGLFHGRAKGAEIPGVQGTLWAWLNSVTEFSGAVRRSKTPEHQFDNDVFGKGVQLKKVALDVADQVFA